MPKGPRGEKRPADANACAVTVARIATGEASEIYSASGARSEGARGKSPSARFGRERRSAKMSDVDKLHTLLFNQGRELVNIKFLPGTARGLTSNRLRAAAAEAIESAIADGMKDAPPITGVKKIAM